MAGKSQGRPTTETSHFATLLVMALAPEEVGKRIEEARKAKGWTHQELAERMGVYMRTVQRWQKGRDPKTGKSWLPRLNTLMDLADVFELPRSYFVETEDAQAQLRELGKRVDELERIVAGLPPPDGPPPADEP